MADMTRRSGLGRGLAALIPPGADDGGGGVAVRELALDAVVPNPRQPRGVFDDDELAGLAASIRDVGVLQPILVRSLGDERFELVAGERRWRAAALAGRTHVPAVVRDTSDGDLLKEALIENIHRVQLNPLEEAAAYRQLLDDFAVTQDELARRLGRSRSTITNLLRLLSLEPAVQRKVAAGVLSAGHAKALAAIDDTDAQVRLADRIVGEGLSVRATEELVRLRFTGAEGDDHGSRSDAPAPPAPRRAALAPGLIDLQHDLSDALGTRVTISMGARKGAMRIDVGSVEDLQRIVGIIAQGLQTDVAIQPPGTTPAP
jgi:ParB family chromosome partitioning protein